MHRQPFLQLLNEYTTDIEDEKKMFVQCREFVAQEADCFERTLAIGHITASVWIVNQTMDKTLLTHHVKINKWLQPGGHCDGETDVLQSALRELEVETVIKNIRIIPTIFDLDVHEIAAWKQEPAHFHYDVRFLVLADDTEPILISDESNDLQWFHLHEVRDANPSRSLERMVEKTILAKEMNQFLI